jgi:hypothetical protein
VPAAATATSASAVRRTRRNCAAAADAARGGGLVYHHDFLGAMNMALLVLAAIQCVHRPVQLQTARVLPVVSRRRRKPPDA